MSDFGPNDVFEPLPLPRPALKARVDAAAPDPSRTPERWFEPAAAFLAEPAESAASDPETSRRATPGRGIVAVLLATSLASAVVVTGGAFLALNPTHGFPAAPSLASAVPETAAPETSTIAAAVAKANRAVVQIVAGNGGAAAVGAGVIFDVRGWVLTNKHVVAGLQTLTVRLADDRRVSGAIYGLDTLSDLAIVKLKDATGVSSADMGDSAGLRVGQLAIAIGSPRGLADPTSVSSGIVSALGRNASAAGPGAGVGSAPGSTVGSAARSGSGSAIDGGSANAPSSDLQGLIQTSAAIDPRDSGGPLVDAEGRVVGITTIPAGARPRVGFAIPIDIAKPIMQQALAGEPLSRPYIGISYLLLNEQLKAQYNLDLDAGAWIHKEDGSGNSLPAISSGSPAALAGLEDGDIVVSLDGTGIDDEHPLEDLLVRYAPGRTVSLQVYRGGSYTFVRLTLGSRPNNPS